jgi:hypothetical protein
MGKIIQSTDRQDDRRVCPRIKVKNMTLNISTLDELKTPLTGKIREISETGFSAHINKPLPPYTKVIATTVYQDNYLMVEAEIRWIQEQKKDRYLYGFCFTQSDKLLVDFINTNQAKLNILDRRSKRSEKNPPDKQKIKPSNQPISTKAPGASALVFSNKYLEAGYSSYTRFFLKNLYELVVVKFSTKYVWNCPPRHIIDFYNRFLSANHLEVGIGNGCLMELCHFPVEKPRLAVSDINENCLAVSAERLARFQPEIYKFNILEPISLPVPRFDSIGLNAVLHCLPGTLRTKNVVFEHLKTLLNPGGIILGTTILNQGVKHSLRARLAIRFYYTINVFRNIYDDLTELEFVLKNNFNNYGIETIGSIVFFWGKI